MDQDYLGSASNSLRLCLQISRVVIHLCRLPAFVCLWLKHRSSDDPESHTGDLEVLEVDNMSVIKEQQRMFLSGENSFLFFALL